MAKKFNYHDVYVQWGSGPEVCMFDKYFIELTCNRVGGWCLWRTDTEPHQMLGGEYDDKPLKIRVGDRVILDTYPSVKNEAPA